MATVAKEKAASLATPTLGLFSPRETMTSPGDFSFFQIFRANIKGNVKTLIQRASKEGWITERERNKRIGEIKRKRRQEARVKKKESDSRRKKQSIERGRIRIRKIKRSAKSYKRKQRFSSISSSSHRECLHDMPLLQLARMCDLCIDFARVSTNKSPFIV